VRRDASTPSVPPLPADLAILTPLRLSSELLLKIAAKARKQGVAAHEVLLAEEIVTPEDYYRCLAQAVNLPFSWDPRELGPAVAEPSALRAGIAHGVAPGTLVMAPQGEALLGLLDLHAKRRAPSGKRVVITTPGRFALWVRRPAARPSPSAQAMTSAAQTPA